MTNERRLFASLSAIDDEVNRRLHRRLVDAANAAGLLDVAYRTIDTPVGLLLLAATPKGLVRGLRTRAKTTTWCWKASPAM